MLADVPLHVVEQRVVFRKGNIGNLATPVCRRVGAGKGDDWKSSCSLSGRQPRYTLGRCSVSGCLVGLESRPVIAGVSPLELVDDMRREDVGLLDDTYRCLWCEDLAVVVRNRADIAPCGCLAGRVGTCLATDGCHQCQCVP